MNWENKVRWTANLNGFWDCRGRSQYRDAFAADRHPPHGSSYLELDTQNVLFWDAENEVWL